MKKLTKSHPFKVGENHYEIVPTKGTYCFTLLKNGNPVDNIHGMTSTCLESPRLRFASEDPLWEYSLGDRIAMEDAIAFLEKKYNNQN